MIRIGIDARPLSNWLGGSSNYLQNIVSELERLDSRNEYYLYSNRDFTLGFENPRWHKRVAARFAFMPGTLWLQTEAKKMMVDDRIDVFWGAEQALPFGLPRSVTKIMTVLDLMWRLFPETMAFYTQFVHRLLADRWVREADRIVAISESVGHDLERTLRVPASKIRVVRLGTSPHYHQADPVAASSYMAGKYGISERYLCTVSTISPRKNLITLVETIQILKTRGGQHHQLVVAGVKGWRNSKLYARVKELKLTPEDVHFLGFVPDEDLRFLYAGAAAFVFPSLYEGFGLPLVEAMACGAPVVASTAPAIPEVVGDAGILVPPRDARGFADAITRVAEDLDLRQSLVNKGFRRAADFRWDRAAAEILRLFEEGILT